MEITEEPSRTDERDEDRAGGRKRGKRRAEKTPREVTDEKDATRGGDGRGRRVKHTHYYYPTCSVPMENVSIDNPRRFAQDIALPACPLPAGFSSLPSENIIQPSFVLRKQGRGKRGGRNGRQRAAGMVVTLRALNIQLLYHEISARKLDNATLVGVSIGERPRKRRAGDGGNG